MTRVPASRGFTLIELLVALAIAGLIAALLLQSLRTGLAGKARIEVAARAAGETGAVHVFLRTLVHEARLERLYERRGILVPAFRGTARDMIFSAPDAPTPFERGLWRYKLAFDDTARALVLVSADDSAGHHDPERARTARRTTLLERVEAIELSYLGDDGDGRWLPAWSEPERLPAAIRLVVRFSPHDARTWIPLVARTFAESPLHCDFDPVARACR